MVSACSAGTSFSAPSTCARVCATWLPALRTSRPSPTHRIGVRPCLNAALTLALTISSFSPWYWRRSEWPIGHVGALQLGEHRAGDLAGVRAGVVRGDVLGAVLDLQLVAVDQGLHGPQVGEGRQDGDLDGVVVLVGEGEGELLDVGDGLEVVEVHLPVARHQRGAAVLSVRWSVLQCGEAGERLALEVFEAGAATGRDVAECVLVEAQDADGRGGVAAADDA